MPLNRVILQIVYNIEFSRFKYYKLTSGSDFAVVKTNFRSLEC